MPDKPNTACLKCKSAIKYLSDHMFCKDCINTWQRTDLYDVIGWLNYISKIENNPTVEGSKSFYKIIFENVFHDLMPTLEINFDTVTKRYRIQISILTEEDEKYQLFKVERSRLLTKFIGKTIADHIDLFLDGISPSRFLEVNK